MEGAAEALIRSQRVVLGPGTEDQSTGLIGDRGYLQQILRPQIGHEQPLAGIEPFAELGDEVAVDRHDPLAQGVAVPEEPPCGLVVPDALLRALDPVVLEHGLHQRERDRRRLVPPEIGDRDVEFLGTGPRDHAGRQKHAEQRSQTACHAVPHECLP
jgi:hypothetical protein